MSCTHPGTGTAVGMAEEMSAECPDPGPGGLQGQSPGPGRHYGALASGQCPPPSMPAQWSLARWRAYVVTVVLCYINLLNYMNWFVIAGEEWMGILVVT